MRSQHQHATPVPVLIVARRSGLLVLSLFVPLARGWSTPPWEQYVDASHLSFFVQIGANCGTNRCAGVRGEPIWTHQMRYEWPGVVVEANPHTFLKLQANYQAYLHRVTPVNVAIGNRSNGEVLTLYCPGQGNSTSERCTAQHKWAKLYNWTGNAVTTPVWSLADLWSRKVKSTVVDILAIDVEGNEYDILNLPLPRPRPRTIFFETTGFTNNHLNPTGKEKLALVRGLLTSQGYQAVVIGNTQRARNDFWICNASRSTACLD